MKSAVMFAVLLAGCASAPHLDAPAVPEVPEWTEYRKERGVPPVLADAGSAWPGGGTVRSRGTDSSRIQAVSPPYRTGGVVHPWVVSNVAEAARPEFMAVLAASVAEGSGRYVSEDGNVYVMTGGIGSRCPAVEVARLSPGGVLPVVSRAALPSC